MILEVKGMNENVNFLGLSSKSTSLLLYSGRVFLELILWKLNNREGGNGVPGKAANHLAIKGVGH